MCRGRGPGRARAPLGRGHGRGLQGLGLADFLNAAKKAGLWCYGADAGGDASYDTVDFAGPVVLVLGSEGRGLRPRVAGACDLLVSIPLRGRIESLSVSAAAAVLIFAAVSDRQRNLHGA
jgi:23S rRNA (guanosine2251-2'-O)-methyltransferase